MYIEETIMLKRTTAGRTTKQVEPRIDEDDDTYKNTNVSRLLIMIGNL